MVRMSQQPLFGMPGSSKARNLAMAQSAEHRVLCCAGKPPLYFQHDGHSRTIIGIERYKPTEGKAKQRAESSATCSNEGYLYNLLLLDPSHKTKDLVAAFKTGKGWQVC